MLGNRRNVTGIARGLVRRRLDNRSKLEIATNGWLGHPYPTWSMSNKPRKKKESTALAPTKIDRTCGGETTPRNELNSTLDLHSFRSSLVRNFSSPHHTR